jgi:hypothetical protein
MVDHGGFKDATQFLAPENSMCEPETSTNQLLQRARLCVTQAPGRLRSAAKHYGSHLDHHCLHLESRSAQLPGIHADEIRRWIGSG